jgi:hypothetical protein
MTSLRFLPTCFASAVLLLATVAPAPAHALQTCVVSADCAHGFECTVVGTSGCAAAPCEPGTECLPAPCEVRVEMACTPVHCRSDADCSPDMVCHEFPQRCAVTDCACPPDAVDCGCGVAACDPQAEMLCTPRHALPCVAAADCGAGFSCEEQLACSCAGSDGGATPTPKGALPPDGAGAAPAPPSDDVPECSCEPTGERACVPQQIACAEGTNACPAGWSCSEVPSAAAPECRGEDCPVNDPAVFETRFCHPDYATGQGTTSGGPTSVPASPGGVTKGESDDAAEAPPNAASADASNESAACQMGRAPASSGAFTLLALLGALVGLKRRRA